MQVPEVACQATFRVLTQMQPFQMLEHSIVDFVRDELVRESRRWSLFIDTFS